MTAPTESTKHSLTIRLNDHARNHWPELARVDLRFRVNFVYIDGHYPDGTTIKLCRLRYGGSASRWGLTWMWTSRSRPPKILTWLRPDTRSR